MLTIAPLGFALLTACWAFGPDAGSPRRHTASSAALVSLGTFAVLALDATLSALHPLARPSISQGALLPTLVFAIGVGIGSELTRRRLPAGAARLLAGRADANGCRPSPLASESARRRDQRVGSELAVRRCGLAYRRRSRRRDAAAGTVAVASLLVAGALLLSYADIIALYEGVHAGVLGGVALTSVSSRILPNLVCGPPPGSSGPGSPSAPAPRSRRSALTSARSPRCPVLGALPTGDLG